MEELDKPKVSVIAIIVSAVLAAVVFGGGVYANQSNKAKKDQEALKSQITALETEKANLEKQVADSASTTTTAQSDTSTTTTTPSTTPVVTDPTANWKSYENTKYKYSLKYPSDDWYVYGYNTGDEATTATLSISQKNAQDLSHFILVSTGDDADMEKTLTEDSTKTLFSKTQTTFLGNSATQYTWTIVLSGQKIDDSKTIKLVKNGKTYYLSGTTKDYEKIEGKDRGNFEEILSTFKFTN